MGDEAETEVGKRRESAVRLMTSVAATLCGWSFCCMFPSNLLDRLPEKAASQHRPAGRWPSCVRVLHGLQPPICFCGVWMLPTEWAQYCARDSSEDSPTLSQAGLEQLCYWRGHAIMCLCICCLVNRTSRNGGELLQQVSTAFSRFPVSYAGEGRSIHVLLGYRCIHSIK